MNGIEPGLVGLAIATPLVGPGGESEPEEWHLEVRKEVGNSFQSSAGSFLPCSLNFHSDLELFLESYWYINTVSSIYLSQVSTFKVITFFLVMIPGG